MNKSAKELTLEWHERVWNQQDEKAIFELMDEDCKTRGLQLPCPGPEGFVQFHRLYLSIYENIHIDVFELIEEGDLAIGHARVTGTHKKTGNKIDTVFSMSIRWKDGKVIEARNVVDYVTLLGQMGALIPEIMVQAFTK